MMDGEGPGSGGQPEMKNKKPTGLSVSLKSDPCLLPFDDKQTPTPTLFGLLQSGANSAVNRSSASTSSNPFDEHFKAAAAAAATSGGSIFVSQTSVEAGGSTTNSLNTPQIFPNLLETSTGNAVLPRSPPPLTQTKSPKRLRPLIPKKQEDGQITLNIPPHLVLDPPEAKRKHPKPAAVAASKVNEDDEKKQELLERNRLAAQRSRIRKKQQSKEVKTDNEKLRLENRNLEAENTALKEEVKRLQRVVAALVNQQQHVLPPKIVTINPPQTLVLEQHPATKVVTRDILSEATLAAQLQGGDLMPVVEQGPSSSGFVRVTADSVSVLNTQVPQKNQEQTKFVMTKGPIQSSHLVDKNSWLFSPNFEPEDYCFTPVDTYSGDSL